jgi:hypothetical protein
VNFCWFFFKWGAGLALVVALALSPFYYRQVFFRVDEGVRSRIEARIAQHFPHLEVHVRGAHLVSDGIEVRGVSLLEPGVTGPQPELAYLDEVFLACRTDLQELVAGEPKITLVKLTRPVIRATRRPDGRFSISQLVCKPKADVQLPPVQIENGVVEVFDPLTNPSRRLTLHDIQLTVRPPAADEPADRHVELQGYVAGDHLRRVELIGTLDPETSQ